MARGDTDALRGVIHSFFASIPNDWYRKNRLSGFEGYYASLVYAYFASVGYEVIPEDTTNKGRIDLTVKTRTGVWIFEFKVEGLDRSGVKSPLAQLNEKGYAQKYRSDGRPLRQIGIVFDAESRNIEAFALLRAIIDEVAPDAAASLVADLVDRYPNRPAMREELARAIRLR